MKHALSGGAVAARKGRRRGFTPAPGVAVGSLAVASDFAAFVGGSLVQLTAVARSPLGLRMSTAISWSSDNAAVATVDASGVVTPVSVGEVNITASAGGLTATSVGTVSANALGLPQLEAVAAQHGASIIGAYHGEVATVGGGVMTAWPDARGAGPTLNANRASKPAYDAVKKSISFADGVEQGLLCTDAAFNPITDSIAVVAVMTPPTNFTVGAAQHYIISTGNANGPIIQCFNDNTVANRVNYFEQGSGVNIHGDQMDLPDTVNRTVFAWTLWYNQANVLNSSLGPRRYRCIQTSSMPPALDTQQSATAMNDPMTVFSFGQHRGGTFGGGMAVAEVAAILIIKLDSTKGYNQELQAAVNAWAEQYAGAVAYESAPVAIAAGADIQAAVDANVAGTVFSLANGAYLGQTIVPKDGMTFRGSGATVLDGNGVAGKAFSGAATAVRLIDLEVTNYTVAVSDGAIRGDYTEATQWLLDNLNVHHITGGAGVYVSDDIWIRHCHIHHNGQIGLLGKSNRGILEDSEVDSNNTGGNDPTGEAGGMKFVYSDGFITRRNNVHDNIGPGIWYDTNNIRGLIEDNVCTNNTHSGIFYEVSYQGIIRRNRVTGSGFGGSIARAAIQIAESPSCEVYDNVCTGNAHCIAAIAADRSAVPASYGAHLVTGLYVHDNDIVQPNDGSASALDDQIGDGAVWGAGANNRFNLNHYDVRNNPLPFDGPGGGSKAAWLAAGYDAGATFAS